MEQPHNPVYGEAAPILTHPPKGLVGRGEGLK